MFGKGGGPLNTWIKEFCELVFIQTLQAFIYAIVIAFIIAILKEDYATEMDIGSHNTAVGIICVVALTAIFKVEDIARRIFGFGKTPADRGNAIASLAKTGFALKLGKNVLDNGAKIVGGAAAIGSSHSKRVKLRQDREKDIDAVEKDRRAALGANTNSSKVSNTGSNSQGALIDSQKRDQKIAATNDMATIRKRDAKEKDPVKKAALKEEFMKVREQGRAIDDKIPTTTADSEISSSSVTQSSGGIKDYNQKLREIEKNYEAEESKLKKERREGIKNIARGLTETGTAIVGATAGGIIGGADGDFDGAARGMVAGAGIGDWVGKSAVDLTASTEEFLENRAKNLSNLVDEYQENVKTVMSDTQKASDNLEKQAQDAIHDINSQIERATKGAGKSSRSTYTKALKMTASNHSIKSLDSRYEAKRASLDLKLKSENAPRTDDKDVLH